jgi:hypothetical protein
MAGSFGLKAIFAESSLISSRTLIVRPSLNLIDRQLRAHFCLFNSGFKMAIPVKDLSKLYENFIIKARHGES